MNILLTSAEGPDSQGLAIMKDCIQQVMKGWRAFTLTPSLSQTQWQGAETSQHLLTNDRLRSRGGDDWTYDGTLTDCIDFGHLHQDQLLPQEQPWDLVMIGVELGRVYGAPDALRSTATAAALLASAAYGSPAHVVLQAKAPDEKEQYTLTHQMLFETLRAIRVAPAETFITNLPYVRPAGTALLPLAHYSTLRLPPTTIVPRANLENTAATAAQKGWVTHSRATLRLNPELRY